MAAKQETFSIEELKESWKHFKKDPISKQHPKFLKSNLELTLVYFQEDVENADHKPQFTQAEIYDDMLSSFHDQIESEPTKDFDEKIVTKQIGLLVNDFVKFIKQNQWTIQKSR